MQEETPIGTKVEVTKMLYFGAVMVPEKKMFLNGKEIIVPEHRDIKLRKYKHRA